MLKKLLKHEWKAVWKLLISLNAFMLGLTAIGGFGILMIGNTYSTSNESLTGIVAALYFMVYALSIFALCVSTIIYLGVRFYRSMYGDEGYLTNTLPATPLQLIVSKLFIAFIWYVILGIVLFFSVFILVLCAAAASGEMMSLTEFWVGVREVWVRLSAEGYNLPGYIILFSANMIIGAISGILTIYASLAIGQLFDKYRVISAVGVYFGINMAFQIVTTILSFIIFRSAGLDMKPEFYISAPLWMSLLMNTAFCAGTFLLTHWITKKKLNLE